MTSPQPVSHPHIPEPPAEKPRSGRREILSTIGILVAAMLVSLFIITFVFRSYAVDGPSMETTLQNSDKLIIWKVPRTWADITRHDYIPQRGDIVVFNEPGLQSDGSKGDKQLIKRVIALPGEHVTVKDGSLTVYNNEHPSGFSPDKSLPYGKNISETTGNTDITLGSDQLFVCGDNRLESLDSRTFGPIKADQIVGKLVMRIFPISQAKAF
ncbi:MAG TPA: signal peptidase I [Candidatus Saccharimonadales bacterium]|nr:signal peptidase I [Candidatus Saccharimonadales bacterium]